MKLRYALLLASVVMIVGAVVHFLWWHSTVLERGSIANLSVVQYPASDPLTVRVSGEAIYPIEKVFTTVQGSSIVLYVYAFPVRPWRADRFDYDVTVPASVNEISFGRNRVVIWKRELNR